MIKIDYIYEAVFSKSFGLSDVKYTLLVTGFNENKLLGKNLYLEGKTEFTSGDWNKEMSAITFDKDDESNTIDFIFTEIGHKDDYPEYLL